MMKLTKNVLLYAATLCAVITSNAESATLMYVVLTDFLLQFLASAFLYQTTALQSSAEI